MESDELAALLSPDGRQLLDEVGPIDTTAEAATTVSRLRRAGFDADLVAAVVGQARLRTRAHAKFGERAERMLFTRAGLEQATRLRVAELHADRFRDAGMQSVADLGCGIGGDAMGLAARGIRVLAVDADETTAAVAAYNLAPYGDAVTVRQGLAEDTDLAGVDAVWLDPARREGATSSREGATYSRDGATSSREGATYSREGARSGIRTSPRRLRADEWSPSLEWVLQLAERMPIGVKLGPALDRNRIPDHVEAQWISADGSTIELVLWSGALARPSVRRAALVLRGDRAWELTASADTPDAPVRELGAFVHEPDGAVIRARLIGDIARDLDAGMLDEHIAYLTSDAERTSPFAQSFRVREVLPLKPKAISAALRKAGVGTVEIKKRGVDIDPAAFRRSLTLRGDANATLLLTRIGSRRMAILADRVR